MSTAVPPGEGPERDDDDERSDARGDGVDVDAAWAQILAHWDDPAPARSPSRRHAEGPAEPATDDARPGRHRLDSAGQPLAPAPPPVSSAPPLPPTPPVEQRRRRSDGPAAPRVEPPVDRPVGPRDAPLAEEHWTPPEPPPLPRGGWRSWLPWVGVLGVPFFFVVVVIAKPSLPPLVMLVAVLGFVAGFVTLVMRLPSHRDDGDDGARV